MQDSRSQLSTVNSRKSWIDLLRGVCMMAILLDHTEIYYTGTNIIDYNLYVVDALVIFFFLSGYLFSKPQGFSIGHKLYSILRSLVIPYFVFTIIIALPKAWAHGRAIEALPIAQEILLGHASWFVSALIVAEIIFSFILLLARERPWAVALGCGILFLASCFLPPEHQPYFWNVDNALQAQLFLCAGYLFHRYEWRLRGFLSARFMLFSLTLLVALKAYIYTHCIQLLVYPIRIDSYQIFLLDATLSILLMVALSQKVAHCRWLEWTGRRAIVYYFFCGGVPLLIGRFANQIGFTYTDNYFFVLIVLIPVYLVTSFIAWCVYKFFPFLVKRNS
jgi:fucose 4-O-acetylase-like acetyltransferase